MERTIDRTSYRRNARTCAEREIKKEKKFSFLEYFLNQIIISLLIIAGILAAKYFEINEVEEWIVANMSEGYEITELFEMMKNKVNFYGKEEFLIVPSGDITSGESGENSGEGTLKTAVEGINQMSEDAEFIKDNYSLIIPLKGVVTSVFGCRVSDNEIVSSYHSGLDIAANTGTNINAAHSGVVTLAKNYSSYGNCVIIESGDLVTLYAHCSSLNVKAGQNVEAGECIGKVGMTGNATGPHLHFEVRYQGRFVDPKYVLGDI